jgi:hypothetical protein
MVVGVAIAGPETTVEPETTPTTVVVVSLTAEETLGDAELLVEQALKTSRSPAPPARSRAAVR